MGARLPFVCEKRSSATDTCTAAAVSFADSIASPEGWKAYQDRIGCKEKASGARKAVTTANAAHLVATGKKTKHDANLATLKAAALKAHKDFGTGVKALSDEIQK